MKNCETLQLVCIELVKNVIKVNVNKINVFVKFTLK